MQLLSYNMIFLSFFDTTHRLSLKRCKLEQIKIIIVTFQNLYSQNVSIFQPPTTILTRIGKSVKFAHKKRDGN